MDYIRPVLGLLQGLIIYALVHANFSPATTVCAVIILAFPLFALQVKLPNRKSLPLGLSFLAVMSVVYGIVAYYLFNGIAQSPSYVPAILGAQGVLSAFIIFIFYCVAVEENRLSFPYSTLFSQFWQVQILLILGHMLVYLTWGLCWLAASLFSILGISAIHELVSSQAFFFIMPSFFFGISMAILCRYESIITKLRDILLAFSKFLYPILVVISLGFLIAIPFSYKPMSEFWMILIGLNVLSIILFNGVFQAGPDKTPYPQVFCALIYAAMVLTCLYSFYILKFPYDIIHSYGLKPALFFIMLALLILCLYNLGYVVAIFVSKTPWLSFVKSVNTSLALFVATIYLVLALPGFSIDPLVSRWQSNRLNHNLPITNAANPGEWPAYLAGINLQGKDLHDKDLRFTNFAKTNLRNANLSNADLQNADLQGADLTGTNLSNANLKWAKLDKTILTNANLTGAKLTPGWLYQAVLGNTNLSNTDLSEGPTITPELLNKICGTGIKSPEKIAIKPCK